MKSSFLITAAAAAILAATGIAQAQAPAEHGKAPAARQAPQEKAQSPAPAPAMKEAPAIHDKSAQEKSEHKPSTTGQASPMGSKSMEKPAAESKPEKSNSGQSPSPQTKVQEPTKSGQNAQPEKSSANPSGKANAQSGSASSSSSGASSSSSSSASNTTNVNVNLTTQQRERIRTTVLKSSSAPRVSSVNFSISVGTAVPRTVHLAPVPSVIVEIAPAWRGYEYFIVGDEIVIVAPGTLKIVAVIPA